MSSFELFELQFAYGKLAASNSFLLNRIRWVVDGKKEGFIYEKGGKMGGFFYFLIKKYAFLEIHFLYVYRE